MEAQIHVEELKFDVNYRNFHEFHADCMDSIYRKFISIYEMLCLSGIEKMKMIVHAKVDGVEFDSAFEISRDNTVLFTDTIIQYFEKIEDFEPCAKIMKLCASIKHD